jgi:hypothetical protein
MTFDEFKEFYESKGYLPNDIGRRKNRLNEKQLKTRFEKYQKSIEKKGYTKDIEWEELKSHLNLNKCSLLKRLEEEGMLEEIEELKNNADWLMRTIDPAHIFPKGGYPYLKYDLDNVVPLNRYSHSCLDTMRDPISGEPIEKYKQLEEKVREYGETR